MGDEVSTDAYSYALQSLAAQIRTMAWERDALREEVNALTKQRDAQIRLNLARAAEHESLEKTEAERDDLRLRCEAAERERNAMRAWILEHTTPARPGSWPCYHAVRGSLHAQWREEDNSLSPLLTPTQSLDVTLKGRL